MIVEEAWILPLGATAVDVDGNALDKALLQKCLPMIVHGCSCVMTVLIQKDKLEFNHLDPRQDRARAKSNNWKKR